MVSPLGVLTRKFNPTSIKDIEGGNAYYSTLSPAVTGYTFMYLPKLPKIINTGYNSYIISAMTRGFTLPQLSISENVFDLYQPMPLPGKFNSGTDLSIKMIDSVDLISTGLFTEWVKAIRPTSADASLGQHKQLLRRIKQGLYVESYSVDLIIFTTDPTLSEVMYAVLLKGAWPSNLPMDILNVEISGVDAYTYTQNFKVKQVVPFNPSSDIIAYLSKVVLPNLQENYDVLD